jgi:hypothetical protein
MSEHFLFRLLPPRPTFATEMTAGEAALMKEHIGYWNGLIETGSAIVFGPVMAKEGPWGLGIIEAADETGAKLVAEGDPTIKARLHRYELIPMRIGAIRKEKA